MLIYRSMRGSFKSSVLLMAALCLCSPKGWTADTVTFSESQKDTAKCVSDQGDVSCDSFTAGKFTVKAVLLKGADLSGLAALLDPSTDIAINVGNWSFSGVLGDDPKYVAGASKAKFNLTHQKCDNNDVCKDVSHGTISVAGSATKGITVSISVKTGTTFGDTEEFETSAIAGQHADDTGDVPGTSADIADVITVSLDIGDGTITDSVDINISGSVSTKGVTTKDASEFDLNSVKVKSTGIVQ